MAVKKKLKKEAVKKKLNVNQEKFCRLYAQNTYLFGNAVLCYAAAYGYDLDNLSREDVHVKIPDPDVLGKEIEKKVDDSPYFKTYKACQMSSSRLLSNDIINERINVLLREVMTPERVDSEISHVMMQKEDFSAKMKAISEFNKLNGRIIDKKQIEHKGLNLKDLYDTSTKEGTSE